MQLQGFDSTVPKYNGICDAIRKVYKHEGFFGFYRGLSMTYLKTAPAVAIQFGTIEKLNKLFKNQDKDI